MSKSNGKSKRFLTCTTKTFGFGASTAPRESRPLYVCLDNADTVIEGGPSLRASLYFPQTDLGVPHPSLFEGWVAILPIPEKKERFSPFVPSRISHFLTMLQVPVHMQLRLGQRQQTRSWRSDGLQDC